MPKVKSRAGTNVKILGHQPPGVLRDHLQRARAFLFAAEEDFGIAPLEAQACGTPVIGYAKGGLVETIRGLNDATPSGVFFNEQSAEALRDGVQRFEREGGSITAEACRANALRFEPARFRREFRDYVDAKVGEFTASGRRAS
jgi:glycosyltransferase involved in cell wall biosynthesis